MPPRSKTATDAGRNDTRRNGKRPKRSPGVAPKAYTGRTTGGYSPAALERRAAKRTTQS